VSLQKAKIYFLKSGDKEKSLPYYWASTILTGQSGSVKEPRTFPWAIIIAAGLIIIFSFFVRKYSGKSSPD
jgi:hypothetical protein